MGKYDDNEPLYLWTTKDLYQQLLFCHRMIHEYTDKLVSATNSGQIIRTVNDMNKLFDHYL